MICSIIFNQMYPLIKISTPLYCSKDDENLIVYPPINFSIIYDLNIVNLNELPESETTYYETKLVPEYNSFKSYMSYKAITNKESEQYKLQQVAETNEYGIRVIEDRYCIALGTFFSTKIGTEIDVIMANGAIIKCVLGDIKADIHTDNNNIKTSDGSVVEFIVDIDNLPDKAKYHGDMSYCSEDFKGEILEIKIYEKEKE